MVEGWSLRSAVPEEGPSVHLSGVGGWGDTLSVAQLEPGVIRSLRRLQSFQGGGRIPNPLAAPLCQPLMQRSALARTAEGFSLGVRGCRSQEGLVGQGGGGEGRVRWKGTTGPALGSPGSRAVPTWECGLLSTPAHSETLRARRASPREGPPSLSLVVPAPEQEGVRCPSGASENGTGPCPGSLSSLQPRWTHGVSWFDRSPGSPAWLVGGCRLCPSSQRVSVCGC